MWLLILLLLLLFGSYELFWTFFRTAYWWRGLPLRGGLCFCWFKNEQFSFIKKKKRHVTHVHVFINDIMTYIDKYQAVSHSPQAQCLYVMFSLLSALLLSHASECDKDTHWLLQ